MTETIRTKEEVRQFYDQIGWQVEEDGFYQNARYEDLRPVASEYIQRCHRRVKSHLAEDGKYLLDAGSGPVQYPEYQTYSKNYQYRICADISITALKEARKRLGDHALCVVTDVAHLPLKSDLVDGLVSLHTLHHLPEADQKLAYREFFRVLEAGKSGVVVNGWTDSPLMRQLHFLVRGMEFLAHQWQKIQGKGKVQESQPLVKSKKVEKPTGTFIKKMDADGLRQDLAGEIPCQILVWRSVNVRFLRAVFHEKLAGRFGLKLLFRLEENFPNYFGEKGQYPLVVFYKPENPGMENENGLVR